MGVEIIRLERTSESMFVLEKNIIPLPRKIENRNERIVLARVSDGNFTIETNGSSTLILEAKKRILNDFSEKICVSDSKGSYKIVIKTDAFDERFNGVDSDEAYYIDADASGATLCGKTEKGAFYAAVTFTKMTYVEDGCLYLALADIFDYPSFAYRAPFMECRYGTDLMTEEDWKEAIDYLSDMKFNAIVMSYYNCWEYQYDGDRVEYLYFNMKKYPELKTPKKKKFYSVKEKKWINEVVNIPLAENEGSIRRIAEYAKTKNIALIPGVATLGHNALIPRMIPETSAVKENGEITGSGFCTASPKAYEALFDLMDEYIDNISTPLGIDSFQTGLDEVMWWDDCHCPVCSSREKSDILFDHLIKVATHLKSKGVKRIIVSHDMLFKYSERLEELKERLIKEDLYDRIVIDWWTYTDTLFRGESEKAAEVASKFKGVTLCMTGYMNWTLTGDNNINVRNCATFSKNNNFEGMSSYTTYDKAFDKNYLTLAEVSWNTDTIENVDDFNERYAYRYYPEDSARAVSAFSSLEKIMHNPNSFLPKMTDFDYYRFSYRNLEKPNEIPTGKDAFPGKSYLQLVEKPEESFTALEASKNCAASALTFLESNGNSSYMNKVWTLTAKQYEVHANEYLTIFGLAKQYKEGACSAFEVISALDTLISEREELMAFAEDVKAPSTAYTYLRDMSIFRQIMIDLRDYFKSEISAGRKPHFDVTDWSNITGKALDFLR